MVVESHHWMDHVMTQEEEVKFWIHIPECPQQIIAMGEILQDARETENHFQMLGMRRKIYSKPNVNGL